MNSKLNKKTSFKQDFKKRCFKFSLLVLKVSEEFRKERKNWPLVDQLIRSATSVGANVVEGGSSVSRREFINYFQIALKSSSETLYWLALLQEINPSLSEDTDIMINECIEIKKLLTTIILNTKNNSKFNS